MCRIVLPLHVMLLSTVHSRPLSDHLMHTLSDDVRLPAGMVSTFIASQDCLKLIDREGRIAALNQHGVCMLQLGDAAQALGAGWAGLWPLHMRQVVRDAIARAFEGHVTTFTGARPTAMGIWIDWHVIEVPLHLADDGGDTLHLLASSRIWPPLEVDGLTGAVGTWAPVHRPLGIPVDANGRFDDSDAPSGRIYGPLGGTVVLACTDRERVGRLETQLHDHGYISLNMHSAASLAHLLRRVEAQAVVTDAGFRAVGGGDAAVDTALEMAAGPVSEVMLADGEGGALAAALPPPPPASSVERHHPGQRR